MKKFTFVLFICTLVVLVVGKWHWNQEIKSQVAAAKQTFEKETVTIKSEDKWKGIKWVSYGDSISASNKWQPHVVKEFGLRHSLRAIGGTTVADTGSVAWLDESGKYLDKPIKYGGSTDIQPEDSSEINSSMSSEDRINMIPTDTELITILGGSNDWSQSVPLGTIKDKSTDTFYGAYQTMLNKLQDRVPNAQIVILLSPFRADMFENKEGLELDAYREATREIAKKYDYPTINTAEAGINQSNYKQYLEDVVHLNDEGGKKISEVVISGLEKIKPENNK